MRARIFVIWMLLSLPAFAGWNEETQRRYNERAKIHLREAHARMTKAVEASVYLLGASRQTEHPRKARTFPIKPYKDDEPIKEERVLKGIELQMLEKTWRALAGQDYYMQMMCHFPIYGLRFRDADGRTLFETSICWGCSNYYIQTKDGYTWAALPMRHLKESDFRKLLDGLFKNSSK